jgi:hypothetical protein
MILLTNGCSWTWGGGLEYVISTNNSIPKNISTFPEINSDGLDDIRYASVWPYHLGNALKVDKTINLALGGGSNQRIVRTTLNWIMSQSPEDLEKTVAVIQWTDPARYEYYTPLNENDPIENIDYRWARVKIDLCISRVEEHVPYKERLNRSQRRFETYTDIESMYRTISEMTTLSYVFNKYNMKYFFWDRNGAYPISAVDHKFVKNIYPEPFKTFILNNFNWITVDNSEYERLLKYNDSHPSLEGHKQIAELIHNQIVGKI